MTLVRSWSAGGGRRLVVVLRRIRDDVIDAVPDAEHDGEGPVAVTGNRLVALRAPTDPVRGDPPVAHSPVGLVVRTGKRHADLRALALHGHVRVERDPLGRGLDDLAAERLAVRADGCCVGTAGEADLEGQRGQ